MSSKNPQLDKIRKSIGSNDIQGAIAAIRILPDLSAEYSGLLEVTAGKYSKIKRHLAFGQISFSEAVMMESQAASALLDIVELYAQSETEASSKTPAVFISYNHKDTRVAESLKQFLEIAGIKVQMDSISMRPGENIDEFITNSISDCPVILNVLSKNSLLSSWVAAETIKVKMAGSKKLFIPCCIDYEFNNEKFATESYQTLQDQIAAIKEQQITRIKAGLAARDLESQSLRLNNLLNNFDFILKSFRESLCIDVKGKNLALNIPKIISAVKEFYA